MAELWVGVGMGSRLPPFIGGISLPRDNFYFGVPDKCISAHFQWPGKEIFAMRMTPLFTHIFINLTKELGTKIIRNTTDLLPYLKHYVLWVASTSVSTGWQFQLVTRAFGEPCVLLLTVFPDAFSTAFTISRTEYPLPVPRL